MSTRGAVLLKINEGAYEAYYHHCDCYPTWLGIKLAGLLKQGKTKEEIIKELNLEDYKRTFSGTFALEAAKQVFPDVQGDLEWIYAVNLGSHPSLQIFRTSNPALIHGPDFVFSVWFSYVEYFPKNIKAEMAEVDAVAYATLNGLAAYHEAIITKPGVLERIEKLSKKE